MDVIFTRLGERAYESVVTRTDGTRYRVRGVGRQFRVPHDLVHFVIEEALGLKHGFWGSIAAGAIYPSMEHVSGRRKPHVRKRSDEIHKKFDAEISEAETIVGRVNRVLEDEPTDPAGAVTVLLRDRSPVRRGRHHPRAFTTEQVIAACDAWADVRDRWDALPTGGRLELTWVP